MAFRGERVSVTQAATVIADGAQGDDFLVRNRSAADSVDLGGATVAAGAGFELGAGESVNVQIIDTDKLYGIAGAGKTVRVDVIRKTS
jgi:hypothetical protein